MIGSAFEVSTDSMPADWYQNRTYTTEELLFILAHAKQKVDFSHTPLFRANEGSEDDPSKLLAAILQAGYLAKKRPHLDQLEIYSGEDPVMLKLVSDKVKVIDQELDPRASKSIDPDIQPFATTELIRKGLLHWEFLKQRDSDPQQMSCHNALGELFKTMIEAFRINLMPEAGKFNKVATRTIKDIYDFKYPNLLHYYRCSIPALISTLITSGFEKEGQVIHDWFVLSKEAIKTHTMPDQTYENVAKMLSGLLINSLGLREVLIEHDEDIKEGEIYTLVAQIIALSLKNPIFDLPFNLSIYQLMDEYFKKRISAVMPEESESENRQEHDWHVCYEDVSGDESASEELVARIESLNLNDESDDVERLWVEPFMPRLQPFEGRAGELNRECMLYYIKELSSIAVQTDQPPNAERFDHLMSGCFQTLVGNTHKFWGPRAAQALHNSLWQMREMYQAQDEPDPIQYANFLKLCLGRRGGYFETLFFQIAVECLFASDNSPFKEPFQLKHCRPHIGPQDTSEIYRDAWKKQGKLEAKLVLTSERLQRKECDLEDANQMRAQLAQENEQLQGSVEKLLKLLNMRSTTHAESPKRSRLRRPSKEEKVQAAKPVTLKNIDKLLIEEGGQHSPKKLTEERRGMSSSALLFSAQSAKKDKAKRGSVKPKQFDTEQSRKENRTELIYGSPNSSRKKKSRKQVH